MKPVSIERRISEFMIMPCLRKMVSGVSSWFTFKFSQFFLKTSFSKFFFFTVSYFILLYCIGFFKVGKRKAASKQKVKCVGYEKGGEEHVLLDYFRIDDLSPKFPK